MATLPMDGYIRVSQVAGRGGDRFQSPETQRDAIKAWAKANGVRIGAWHDDLDRSGGTMDRPGMNAALERVRAGKSGGVIVARFDRFARTVLGGLKVIEELDALDARVVSVAEGLDPATPHGKAMLSIVLAMAQWQRDLADEALGSAQSRAASAGRFPGRPSFGYARDEDDGRTLVVDEDAAIVRRIFTERAGGSGWRRIADGLTQDGIPTPHNGRARWAPTTVHDIVKREQYLGVFIGPRGLRIEDAWPALVDRDVWNRANARHGVRDDARNYHDRLFAGIARCAGCRAVMVRAVNTHGFVSYGCPTRGCRGGGTISADLLDRLVGDVVDERLASIVLEPRAADDGAEWRGLRAARDAKVKELELWRDDTGLRAALGDADWRAGLLARARARDDAETALAEHRATSGLPEFDLPDGVVPSLETLPWAVRRDVVEALLHSVWVRKSEARGRAAAKHGARRIRVVWADDSAAPTLPSRNGADALEALAW